MDHADWTLLWKIKYDDNRYKNCDTCMLPIAIVYRICPNYNYTAMETKNASKIGRLVCEKCLNKYNPYVDTIKYQFNTNYENCVTYSEITIRNLVYSRTNVSRFIDEKNLLPNRKL